jgi:hypothetical protein
MTPVPAHLLEPVPTAGCFPLRSASGPLHLPEALETKSSPSLRVRTPTFPQAHTNADFLAWDIVDEWGAQSFPASDPPANW